MLTKVIKTVLKLFFVVRRFKWVSAYRSHDSKSNNVIIIYPDKWKNLIQYFYSDSFLTDLALVESVVTVKGNYKLQFGLRDLANIQNSTVYFNMSERFNKEGYQNYTKSILYLVDQLEAQRNSCVPNRRDVEFWENKVFMHQEFDRLNVSTPATDILRYGDEIPNSIKYPTIIKEVHSKGAEGVYKVSSKVDLEELLSSKSIWRDNNELLVQQFLNIRTDIRIVFIGNELMYFHWRYNEKKNEWEPTTYKQGTTADFYNYPDQWREFILDEFKKLDVVSGAFDIAWDNDDYNTEPLVLEVSPSFFPNPTPPKDHHIRYGDYKHKLHFKDSWERSYVENAFYIKQKQVEAYLLRNQRN